MSLNLNIQTNRMITGIFGFITSFFVAVVIIYTLEGPLKNLIAILTGTFVFLLYLYLTDSPYLNYNKMIFYLHDLDKEFILIVYYFLSIMIVLLTSPIQGLYVDDWSLIPPFSWLRLVSAFSLGAFLPGYAILRIIDYKHEISGTPLVVLSHLLSLFFVALVSFTLVILGLFSSYGMTTLPLFNLVTATIYCCLCVFRRGEMSMIRGGLWRRNTSNMLLNGGKLLLLCLLIVYSTMLYSVFFGYNSMLKGDMWRHMYGAIVFLKGGFLQKWNETFYPWWFSLYLAALSMLSGLPPVNTYLLAVFFNVFTILAFLAMVSIFFKKSKVPMLATVIWTLFSGFGWIYAVDHKFKLIDVLTWLDILQDAGNKTMNDTIFCASFTHGYFTATVGLACLFTMIYLTRFEGRKASRIFLMAIVSALAYLVHTAEFAFFIVAVLPCFIVAYSKREESVRLREATASILIGVFLTFIIDLSAPLQFYLKSFPHIYVSIILIILVLTYLKEKFPYKLTLLEALHIHPRSKRIMKFFVVPLLWYVHFLSFLIWLNVYPNFNMNASPWLWRVGLVPWYFYPLLYGVSGILTMFLLTYATYRSKEVLNGLSLFLALIIVTLIFARLITFSNMHWFYTSYWERRIASIGLGISLAVISASAIKRLSSKFNSLQMRHVRGIAKPLAANLILIAIILGGSMSTFLTVDFWTLGGWEVYKISDEETAALNYLKIHAPSSSLVITVSDESNNKVGLAGVTSLMKRLAFFEAEDPETAFSTLAYTSYIYLHKRDVDLLNSMPRSLDGYFMDHLMDHLPIAFKNSEVTIYKVPTFIPPSNSGFALVYPDMVLSTDRLLYPLEMASLSRLKYQVYLHGDISSFSSQTQMIPFDPSFQWKEHIEWINKGGTLVILNTYGHRFFARLLSVSENGSSSLIDGIYAGDYLIELPDINVPVTFTSDKDVKIIANYMKDSQPISPYAYSKKLGYGEIIYVETLPYFQAIEETNERSVKSALFEKLGLLIEVLNLPVPGVTETPPPIGFSVQEKITINGNVKVIARSMLQDITDINIANLNLSYAKKVLVNGKARNIDIPTHGILQQLNITGSAESEISASELRLEAHGRGGYVVATFSGNLNWTLKLADGSIVYIKLADKDSTYNITVESGSLTLSTEATPSLSMFIKNPKVVATGTSNFNKAYVDPPYSERIDCYGYPLTINGKVAFEIVISDPGTESMGFSWLSYEGTVDVHRPPFQYWDEWKIPWTSVLTSPYHVLLISMITVASVIIYITREKSLRIRVILKKKQHPGVT